MTAIAVRSPLTSHERIARMFAHQEADRVPISDGPWSSTLERWRGEGLPRDVPWEQYLGLDQTRGIGADNGPRYPERVIEETDEWVTATTSWGATRRTWKYRGGVPEYLDFVVKDPDTWREAKARMTPDRDRVDWARLQREYAGWRREGAWITAGLWFGFDITHSHFVGTERLLMAMIEEPEWVREMFEHELSVHLALFDMVWEAGYHVDAVSWPDDMGYKLAQFFSLERYRELLKPVHARACAWARAKGVRVHMHSCGDIRPLVPELIEIGVEMLNPLEVKAGMDPVVLKRCHGDRLAFHGGLNAVLYDDMEAMETAMRRTIPAMMAGGGYWASADHSVPDSVSLKDFQRFVAIAKEVGTYR